MLGGQETATNQEENQNDQQTKSESYLLAQFVYLYNDFDFYLASLDKLIQELLRQQRTTKLEEKQLDTIQACYQVKMITNRQQMTTTTPNQQPRGAE